jgi:hypothetical protein
VKTIIFTPTIIYSLVVALLFAVQGANGSASVHGTRGGHQPEGIRSGGWNDGSRHT